MSLYLDNPAVRTYIECAALCAVQTMGVTTLTAAMRFVRGVFSNPEDVERFGGAVKLDDPVIERIRRSHHNDLENIPPFWFMGLLYLTTSPSVGSAKWLFRSFTISRFIYTLVYAVVPLPQPARAFAFGVAWMINFYMTVKVISAYSGSL